MAPNSASSPSLPLRLRASDKRLKWPKVTKTLGADAVKWRVLIGYRLRLWRLRAGLGQKVGDLARSVLTQDTISRIENGYRKVDGFEIRALATLYRVSPEQLGALFAPPSEAEWESVYSTRVSSPKYRERPTSAIAP